MNHVTHLPVLYHEFLAAAQPLAGQRWVDGTFGRGGHASALLAQGCQVLALDRRTGRTGGRSARRGGRRRWRRTPPSAGSPSGCPRDGRRPRPAV